MKKSVSVFCCSRVKVLSLFPEHARFTLIELLVNAACKPGVLYNRCGMLLSKGGALVRKSTEKYGRVRKGTESGAAEYGWFRPTTKYPAFL